MHLHNRQIRASFWNDADLLQWPRDKRWFYEGLIQLADDSGCLEDSPFAFKVTLFPSPLDSDITVDRLAKWRDELIDDGKLVRYAVGKKTYLYLTNFHKHQTFKNPERPDIPLPPWIRWEPFESNSRAGKYVVSDDVLTRFLQGTDEVLTQFLHLSDDVLRREEKVKRREKNLSSSSNVDLKGYRYSGENMEPPEGLPPLAAAAEESAGQDEEPATEAHSSLVEEACQAVEIRMTVHTGRPFVLKEQDYVTVRSLIESGVPLDFILAAMDRVFERNQGRRISRFAYFLEPIKEQWALELAKRRPVQRLDFSSRDSPYKARDETVPGRRVSSDLPEEVLWAYEFDRKLREERGNARTGAGGGTHTFSHVVGVP